jgi:hypothetical protein
MKKKIMIGIGAVLGVALLAGAVFVTVRLLNEIVSGNSPGILAGMGGPSDSHVEFMLKLTPAPELPIVHPDLTGVVTRIQDNSLFVTQATNVSTNAPPSGPVTEVVVSQKTLIYRDTTLNTVPTPRPGTTTNLGVQQVVELADLSSISTDSFVQVWGQQRGDRLNADMILVQGTEVVQ